MQLNLGSPCLAPIALLATDWHNRKRAHTYTSSMVCSNSPSVLRVLATLKFCCWLGHTGYDPLDKTPVYVPVTVLITILERSWLMTRIHSHNDVIIVAASSGDLRLSRLPCWSSLSLASIVTSWPHLLINNIGFLKAPVKITSKCSIQVWGNNRVLSATFTRSFIFIYIGKVGNTRECSKRW